MTSKPDPWTVLFVLRETSDLIRTALSVDLAREKNFILPEIELGNHCIGSNIGHE